MRPHSLPPKLSVPGATFSGVGELWAAFLASCPGSLYRGGASWGPHGGVPTALSATMLSMVPFQLRPRFLPAPQTHMWPERQDTPGLQVNKEGPLVCPLGISLPPAAGGSLLLLGDSMGSPGPQ